MASSNSWISDRDQLVSSLNELKSALLTFSAMPCETESRYNELCASLNVYFDDLSKKTNWREYESFALLLEDLTKQIKLEIDQLELSQNLVFNILKKISICLDLFSGLELVQSPSSYDSVMSSSLNGSVGDFSNGSTTTSDDFKRKNMIESTIVHPEQNSSKFSQICGLNNAKRMVHNALVMPFILPNLFTEVNIKPLTRILLYGPPGTGKTELARALANEIGAIFFSVSSSDIVSCMFGESEKFIKCLFAYACSLGSPSLIFIDEIDSLARSRSSSEDEHNRRIKTELLVQLSGLERRSSSKPPVAFVCATNLPWEIDCGIMRRFQKKIYIPLPDSEARRSLLRTQAESVRANLSDQDIDELVIATANFTPYDIVTFVQEAFFQTISELETCRRWKYEQNRHVWFPCEEDQDSDAVTCSLANLLPEPVAARPPGMTNFRSALGSVKPSITSSLIAQFEEFTTNFGVNGQ